MKCGNCCIDIRENTHKFVVVGNGGFMQCQSGVIVGPYFDMTVTPDDIEAGIRVAKQLGIIE